MSYAIGIVGATGQVGREFLRILEEGDRVDLPIKGVRLFASERSAGKFLAISLGQKHEEAAMEVAFVRVPSRSAAVAPAFAPVDTVDLV